MELGVRGEGKRGRVGLGWTRKRIQRLLSHSALGLQWRGILKIMKQSEHARRPEPCVRRVVVREARARRLLTSLLCGRHALSLVRTALLHVKQRWGTVPGVHYHSRLTWHCFSKD